MTPAIEALLPEHWPRVAEIYREGIETGNGSFETTVPAWPEWDAAHRSDCRLILRLAGEIAGWVALSPVSRRAVYRGVAEVSIYVAESARGRGVGRALLAALVEASEGSGIWTLQSGTFPENEASIALHKSLGFREVGRRERIGRREGVWRDVILLERRSGCAGIR